MDDESIDNSINNENNDNTLPDKYQNDHDDCLNYLDELYRDLKLQNDLAEKLIKENSFSKVKKHSINETYHSIMLSLDLWKKSNDQLKKNNNDLMDKIMEVNNLIINNKKNNDVLIKMTNETKINNINLQDLARESAYERLSSLPRVQRKELVESLGPYKQDLFPRKGGRKKTRKRFKKNQHRKSIQIKKSKKKIK